MYKRQALCAVACSDDDNKKEDTVIPAQEVAGTYNGTLSLSSNNNESAKLSGEIDFYDKSASKVTGLEIYSYVNSVETVSYTHLILILCRKD